MRELSARGEKSNKRFWKRIEVPDLLSCAVVAGIVILSAGITILLAHTEDVSVPSVPEEANSSDSMIEVNPVPKDKPQPPEQSKPEIQKEMDPDTKAQFQQAFNEIRKEYLDHRAVWVEWWLIGITIVLGFFVIVITVFSFVSFREFQRLRDEAMKNVSEIQDIWDVAHMVKERFEQAMQNAREILDADAIAKLSSDPGFAEALDYLQQFPYLSSIDQTIIDACRSQQRGEIMAAIRTWRSVVNMVEQTDNNLAAVAWNSIGFLYLERDNRQRAFSAFNKAIELREDYAEAYVGRGNVKSLRGQYESAIADYDDAIELGADHAENYSRRANAYNGLGRYDEAIADCNDAIRLNLIYAEAYVVRGEAKNGSGNFSREAVEADFQNALQLATSQGLVNLRTNIEQRLQEL